MMLKMFVYKLIPVWVIYKIVYFRRYMIGYRKCRKEYKPDKKKRKIILLDLPHHGNLGDQAIAVSEYHFLKRYMDSEREELYIFHMNQFVDYWKWLKKNLKPGDLILLHGGGNIGDVYARAEYVRQIALHEFHNRMIIFPQTCYFTDSRWGKMILKRSRIVYAEHSNLIICAREKRSYEMLKGYFPHNKVILIPDIVLAYPANPGNTARKDYAYLCMRKDTEKTITSDNILNIQKFLENEGFSVIVTDTDIDRSDLYDLNEAQGLVDKKIDELGKGRLVVTDRLHGMILSALSGTNCIAFPNYNHKLKGTYHWLESFPGIRFVDSADEFYKAYAEINDVEYSYKAEKYEEYFETLRKLIFDND